MQEPPSFIQIWSAILGATFATLAVAVAAEPYRPAIDPANFTHVVTNPFVALTPGTTAIYQEKDLRETRECKVEVLRTTRNVLGVKCVVVKEIVTLDGVLLEETYDWFAQDRQGAVWYFGEQTQEFKIGGRVSTFGSWEAGVRGAQPGILMPAQPKVGDRFRQEYLANEAEDIGQIVALGETVAVPFGSFQRCVRTREWSMLESGTTKKWYAHGVGFVRSESTGGEVSVLISITRK